MATLVNLPCEGTNGAAYSTVDGVIRVDTPSPTGNTAAYSTSYAAVGTSSLKLTHTSSSNCMSIEKALSATVAAARQYVYIESISGTSVVNINTVLGYSGNMTVGVYIKNGGT